MPKPGDSCDINGDIGFTDDGVPLICRDKRWQRQTPALPSTSGYAVADEQAEGDPA
jgi:hypothetical protein